MRRALLLMPLVGALAACPAGDDDPCVAGDPSRPMELQMVLRQVDGTMAPVVEGGPAPIQTPPQLGKVIYPSVRARNLNFCGVQLTTALRDECQGLTLSIESRPIVLKLAADGWAEPAQPMELSDYGNLPVCPRAAATRDMEGEPYLLTVNLRDQLGRTAEQTAHVVPTCAEPGVVDECTCECDKDYVVGQACTPEPDGGPTGCAPDAGP